MYLQQALLPDISSHVTSMSSCPGMKISKSPALKGIKHNCVYGLTVTQATYSTFSSANCCIMHDSSPLKE